MGVSASASSKKVHAYFDSSDRLVGFEYPAQHSPAKELTFVTTYDTQRFYGDDEVFLLSSEWHAKWIAFVTKKVVEPPTAITNESLVVSDFDKDSDSEGSRPSQIGDPDSEEEVSRDSEDEIEEDEIVEDKEKGREQPQDEPPALRGPHLRPDVKAIVHYRQVNKRVWEFLFKMYGGGPVVTFKVPAGLDPDYYIDGSWITQINLSDITKVIYPCENPVSHYLKELSAAELAVANANMSLIGNLMLNDLSKAKFEQAAALDVKIDEERAHAIIATFASDVGKKKVEDAKTVELETTVEAGDFVKALFQNNEVKEAAVEAAQEAKETAVQAEIAVMMGRTTLKTQFLKAIAENNRKEAIRLGGKMIWNIWLVKRSKIAARRLLRESSACKIQSKYRHYVTHKKLKELAAERHRLLKSACASMIQALWRRKKRTQKLNAIKAEKQRLLEEGAALRVQSRWRIKQSQRKLITLRIQRDDKLNKAYQKSAKIVGKFIRLVYAKLQLREIIEYRRNILTIDLRKGDNLSLRCTNACVYVHIEKGSNHPLYEKSTVRNTKTTALSMFKSQCLAFTSNPRWEEECLAINVTKEDLLVLTVVNQESSTVGVKKDQPPPTDEFLGQAVVFLRDHKEIFEGKRVTLRKLMLGKYSIPLSDINGVKMPMLHMDKPVEGSLDIAIHLVPRGLSQSGWVLKRNAHMFGTQYRVRYVFMINGHVSYCDDEHFIDRPRATIPRHHIALLEYGPDKTNPNDHVLHIRSQDGEEWFFKFLPEENPANIKSWLRKLQYANPHVKLNGKGSNSLVTRTEDKSIYETDVISTGDSVIGLMNTVRVARKRASVILK